MFVTSGAHVCNIFRFTAKDVGSEGFVMHKRADVLYPCYVRIDAVVEGQAVVHTVRYNAAMPTYSNMLDTDTWVNLCACNWVPVKPSNLAGDQVGGDVVVDNVFLYRKDSFSLHNVPSCHRPCRVVATTSHVYDTYLQPALQYMRISGLTERPVLVCSTYWATQVSRCGTVVIKGEKWSVQILAVSKSGAPVVCFSHVDGRTEVDLALLLGPLQSLSKRSGLGVVCNPNFPDADLFWKQVSDARKDTSVLPEYILPLYVGG
jgi:hypothetical protein